MLPTDSVKIARRTIGAEGNGVKIYLPASQWMTFNEESVWTKV